AHPRLAVPAHRSCAAGAIPAACQTRALLARRVPFFLSEMMLEMLRCFSGRVRNVHEPPVCFSPGRVLAEFHFSHTIEYRGPETSEHGKRFAGQDRKSTRLNSSH